MASNTDKKKSRAVEREKYRGTYKVFKELRIWLSLVLVICIVGTVYMGVSQSSSRSDKEALIEDGKLRDEVAVYVNDDDKALFGVNEKDSVISVMSLSYYFYKDYYALINDDSFYTDGYGTYGLDPSKPLKEQEYTALRSWFDELMNTISAAAVNTLQYSILAETHGISLEDDEISAIEEEINALRADAEEEGQTLNEHLSYRYCPGMTEDDARYALERYYLAEKYYYEGAENATTCTDDEISEYYKEHEDELLNAYIYRYEIKFDEDTEEEAIARAEAFVACTDGDSFVKMIKEAAVSDYEMSDEDLTSFLDECCITVKPGDYTGDFADWLFMSQRADGDTYMDKNDGYIGVYYVERAAGKYKFPSANTRSIYLSADYQGSTEAAKAKAEELYALAVENGTEDYFAELAAKYSNDTTTAAYGGSYVDIVPGDLTRKYEKWVFEEGRAVGDIAIIEVDGDYFVTYFTGFGDECWKVAAERELISLKMEEFEAEVEAAARVSTDSNAIYETVPDHLATNDDRGYTVKEKNGKLVFINNNISPWFIVLASLSVIILGGTIFSFVYTYKLRKRFGYSF